MAYRADSRRLPKRKAAVKEKAPYMPFYGRDFYGDLNVMAMNAEQRGVYLHLIWLCWQEGAIPSDVATLAAVTGGFPVAYFQEQVWPKLCDLFKTQEDGKLIHLKVEAIRDGNEAFRKKRSEAGKAGNKVRWEGDRKPIAKPSQSDRKAIAKPSLSSSSSSSSSESNTHCSSGDERGALSLDVFFEERYSRHPKKRDRVLAQQALSEIAGIETADVQEQFRRGHEAWISTDTYQWMGGANCPTLAEFIVDKTWQYPPDTPAEEPRLQSTMDPETKRRMKDWNG